jgi:hypothetical protein
MSDVQDPVVQEVEKPKISTLAEETTPKQEVSQDVSQEPEKEVNPLEPGGDRFKQVWARAKQAEAEAKALQAEIQREREERIRLEERVKVKEEAQSQPEYTWDQLEAGIAEGRWTRAQAQEYKDQQTERRLTQKLAKQKEMEVSNSRVLGEIEQYKSLVPDVTQYGTEARQKVEKEYAYLVRNGAPDNYTTQLAALRAALGDPETIKSRNTTKKVLIEKEPFMETHTSSVTKQAKAPFKDSLPAWKVTEYEKLIKHGVYKDWKEIEDESKWVPKAVNQGRR